MSVPIVYIPSNLGAMESGRGPYSLSLFVEAAPWVSVTPARHEAFFSVNSDPYTYGKGEHARTYYPTLFPDWMLPLKLATEEMAQGPFDLCFLNRYDDERQQLGWHADDAPSQDMRAPIVVQSFGAERDIYFRENGAVGEASIHKQRLADGSSLIMLPGMQLTHQHKIPKHSAPCGPRVSLTWRKLAPQ